MKSVYSTALTDWASRQISSSSFKNVICKLCIYKLHIYIVIHRQTVSFYQNSSVWLDTQDARSWDRNPSNFTIDCVSDHSATKRTTLAKGILRYFLFLFLETAAAAAFVYILLYPIGYQSAPSQRPKTVGEDYFFYRIYMRNII